MDNSKIEISDDNNHAIPAMTRIATEPDIIIEKFLTNDCLNIKAKMNADKSTIGIISNDATP